MKTVLFVNACMRGVESRTLALCRAFLDALPENGFHAMNGIAPRAGERLPGCPFAPRCSRAMPKCHRDRPPAYAPMDGRRVRCFLYE